MTQRTWKQMIPKNNRDKATLSFFLIGIPFAIWFELCLVMDSTVHSIKLHSFIAVFLAVQVLWNLLYMLQIDTTIQSIADLQASYPYFVICDKCGITPPRSHHCKICDTCILKRDHHCWFAGYCTGYQNHRYYLMTIIYCWIGGLYANILHMPFMIETLGISFRTLLSMVAPHFLWVFGYYTSYEFTIATVFDIAIYFTILLTWLLFHQFVLVINGQTAFERSAGTKSFDKGLRMNIQEILGTQWYLVWIAPCIPSKLPCVESHWFFNKNKDE